MTICVPTMLTTFNSATAAKQWEQYFFIYMSGQEERVVVATFNTIKTYVGMPRQAWCAAVFLNPFWLPPSSSAAVRCCEPFCLN